MKLYGGEIELTFKESSHRYTIGNEVIKGTTTVLSDVYPKPGLMQWAVDLSLDDYISGNPREVARKAYLKKRDSGASVGSTVHKAIEEYIGKVMNEGRGFDVPGLEDEQASRAFEAFLEWEVVHEPKYLFSERIVYSRDHNYAGCADCIALMDGKTVLLDWKTADPKREYKSSRYTGKLMPYTEHFYQLGAYAQALHEEGLSVDSLATVYITKSGNLHMFSTDRVDFFREGFLLALAWARHKAEGERESWND